MLTVLFIEAAHFPRSSRRYCNTMPLLRLPACSHAQNVPPRQIRAVHLLVVKRTTCIQTSRIGVTRSTARTMTVRVCMMQRLEKGLTRLREDQVTGITRTSTKGVNGDLRALHCTVSVRHRQSSRHQGGVRLAWGIPCRRYLAQVHIGGIGPRKRQL